MTENFSLAPVIRASDGHFVNELRMPLSGSNPGFKPGNFSLDVSTNKVKVRLPDLSILSLGPALTGPLTIANGGTGSSATLNNNRVMVSDAGAIKESAALSNGQLLIGSAGLAPVVANISAGSGIAVTNGPGSITISKTPTTRIAIKGYNTFQVPPGDISLILDSAIVSQTDGVLNLSPLTFTAGHTAYYKIQVCGEFSSTDLVGGTAGVTLYSNAIAIATQTTSIIKSAAIFVGTFPVNIFGVALVSAGQDLTVKLSYYPSVGATSDPSFVNSRVEITEFLE